MGIISRFFGRSEPEPATDPAVEARLSEYVRRFNMAMSDRLTADWITSPITIDQELSQDFVTMVVRARDLAVNDDYVRGYLHELEKNVLGVEGIQYIPDPRNQSGKRDTAAARTLADAWHEWSQAGTCDVTGKWSWRDIESLMVKSVERDGEGILVDYPGYRGNRFGFAVQYLDCLQLDPNLNRKSKSGNEIVMGVEVDRFRRPINYYFLKDEIAVQRGSYYESAEHVVIPAGRVTHVYHAEFAHQTRGFSQFASSARNLKLIDGYGEAVVTSARVAAATSAVMNRNTQNQGLASLDKKNDAENIKFQPGMLFDLPFEASITQLKAEQPTTTMPAAIQTWLQKFSAGIGLSYHSVARDLSGVNYTSSRTGELSDRDKYRILHAFYARHLHEPIKNRMLKQALIRRALRQGTGTLSPVRYKKYSCCHWQGRGWDWTDPSKAQKAEDSEVMARRRSPLDVMRERGDRPDKVIADHVEWQEMLSAAGLQATVTNNQAPDKAGIDETESDDTDEEG